MFPIRDHNPSGRRPYVTLVLIALNVAIFLAYYPMGSALEQLQIYDRWGMVPARIMAGMAPETLLTHMFLHGGWFHLAGNMLFLWIFGDNMEDEMGHLGFLVFYMAAGILAAGAQMAPAPWERVPMVGASGAIAGVLGGYLLMFPRARVDVVLVIVILIKVVTLRAYVVLALWFVLQLGLGLTLPMAGEGVAYWAHAGGFVAGLLLTLPLWLRRGGPAFWARNAGAPPHPAEGPLVRTSIPRVRRH